MLIFDNGILQFGSTNQSVELDTRGYPVSANNFDEEVRCTISTLTENKRGNVDGVRYKNCQYSVSIDSNSVDGDFAPTAIKLIHDKKGELGVFTVQRIEYYDITSSIELWV